MSALYSRFGNAANLSARRSLLLPLSGLIFSSSALGLEFEAEAFVSSADGLSVSTLAGEAVISGSPSPDSGASAALATYLVDFPSEGVYEVSARMAASADTAHSLFISIDGRWSIDPVHTNGCSSDGQLAWVGPHSDGSGHCTASVGTVVAVEAPGPTVVSIASPDESLALDRLHFQLTEGAALVASLHEPVATAEAREFVDLGLRVTHAGESDTLAEDISVAITLGESVNYEGHAGCECEIAGVARDMLTCSLDDLWGWEDHSCSVSVSGDGGVATVEVVPQSTSELMTYGSRSEVALPAKTTDIVSLQSSASLEKDAELAVAASRATGCVGNLVWLDANGDGVKEEHESGFRNAEIHLVDLAGTVRQSTIAANGYYELCDVPADYFLEVTIPDGFEPTLRNAAEDDYHDSDAGVDGRIQVTVVADRLIGRHDVGLVLVADVETPQESVAEAEESEEQEVTEEPEADEQSEEQTEQSETVDDVPSPPLSTQAEGCVGNLVWFDSNRDGRKQSSEQGVANIEVELVYPFYGVVDSDVTSSTGYFLLCGPAGEAEVHVNEPNTFAFTTLRAAGNEYHDSDADASGVVTLVVDSGKKRDGYDIGLVSVGQSESTDPVQDETEEEPTEPAVDPVQEELVVVQPVAEWDGLLFGPWVERRHRNDGVFGRFDAALTGLVTSEAIEVLEDARNSGTQLFVQLGSTQEWGWNFSNSTSTFTVAKWKRSISRFGDDPVLKQAIAAAVADGTIRGIYLIDEPHHTRWSPGGNSHTHIPNADIDDMARHVKTYWPNASTAVRASPRTLFAYGRDAIDWKYLDEAFLMINFRKWSNSGSVRTIEGFMERELDAYREQGLGMIGSIQMLIGAPASNTEWWGAGESPSGKLKTSPREMRAYFEAFTAKRNAAGERAASGTPWTDAVMVFRWDRNSETYWTDVHYDEAMNDLIERAR